MDSQAQLEVAIMMKRICPICDQVMKMPNYCTYCKSWVKYPYIRDVTYYLNETHPRNEENCDYHNHSSSQYTQTERKVKQNQKNPAQSIKSTVEQSLGQSARQTSQRSGQSGGSQRGSWYGSSQSSSQRGGSHSGRCVVTSAWLTVPDSVPQCF